MQSTASDRTTQRRLILIRHAKAVEEVSAGDHARALSERGIADAKALGEWLKAQRLLPELVVCSTATRTRQTLAGLELPQVATILSDKLYLATTGEMLTQIQDTDNGMHTVMMLCHNPGAHALLGLLVGSYANESDIDRLLLKFPTSACAVLSFELASWKHMLPDTGRLEKLRY
jgi:phosphohistidine phosphatase